MSSIGIKNGWSTSLTGCGMCLSTASINSTILLFHSKFGSPSDSIDFNAEPRTIGILSPGNSFFVKSSRTSNSTKSNISGSSTKSTLFMNTTIAGTFTCRANKMCSRVCGIGPSSAATTKIAPSICAAPVIMFLM